LYTIVTIIKKFVSANPTAVRTTEYKRLQNVVRLKQQSKLELKLENGGQAAQNSFRDI